MNNVSTPGSVLSRPRGEVPGDWLELQETLHGLLYQGETAVSPLPRLKGIEQKALDLLQSDPEAGLLILFQALADVALGYCATHALLSAVVCHLTAHKLGMPDTPKQALFRAALTMNIGMARAQDGLARQSSTLNKAQRNLIQEHPKISLEILQNIGVTDEGQLDIVRWHHEPEASGGMASNLESRRILHMADGFVAKMAARKTRLAMSPLGAAKSIFLDAPADTARLGSAMVAAVGFYPPGTYVQLVNGEKAVSVARGLRANNPHVMTIVDAGGMPLSRYLYRDTTDPRFAICAPMNADKIKVHVSLAKVLRARMDRGV